VLRSVLTTAKQNESLRHQLKSAIDVETCVDVAKDIIYDFTTEELQGKLSKMPQAFYSQKRTVN
jgi:Nif11 domain